jgi:hypothetical protein
MSRMEDRVAALESDIKKLKSLIGVSKRAPMPWWEQISGVFADDPTFEKAKKLGREFRESLRPGKRTVAKPRNHHPRH